jgi:hypothetical protein
MADRFKCFLLVPTGRIEVYLRRYLSGSQCQGPMGYHDAMTRIEDAPDHPQERANGDVIPGWIEDKPRDDPRWPVTCTCGFAFPESAAWQTFQQMIWRREDTGEEFTLRDAPIGAMWDASWWHGHPQWVGADGRCLIVRTPGGDWMIDSRCSNCTMPDDNVHKCWVRHGEPPNITVDKNGNTCSAGAGSILCGSYHGFLREGYLDPC